MVAAHHRLPSLNNLCLCVCPSLSHQEKFNVETIVDEQEQLRRKKKGPKIKVRVADE